MFSQIDDPANNSRRIAGLSLLVMLSLAVPAAVVVCSASWAFSGKPFGRPASTHKVYQGAYLNGALWFTQYITVGASTNLQSRIWWLDLSTGAEYDTGLACVDFPYLVRIDDDLFAVTSTALYKLDGSSLEKLPRFPQTPASVPFLYDGRLTIVVSSSDTGYQLVHLVDDHWIDGRTIRLPEPACVWFDDAERGKKVLAPRTSLYPPATTGRSPTWNVSLVQSQDELDIMLWAHRSFAAYRKGFEFDEQNRDIVDAMAPQNSPPDVSGWQHIHPNDETAERWVWITRDRKGLLFGTLGRPFRIVRRTINGQWLEIGGLDRLAAERSLFILAEPTESETYVIAENQRWGSAAVHRIVDDVIQPAHIRIPGKAPGYLARWKYLGVGIVFAWLTHIWIVCAGAAWLTSARASSMYEFGVQRVRLASAQRRSVAFAVDLLIVLALLGLAAWWRSTLLGPEFKAMPEQEFAEFLFQYDLALESGLRNGSLMASFRGVKSFELVVDFIHNHRRFLMLCVTQAIVIISLGLLLEARFGTTPGKWLLGIKTVRSTLRPCGLARSLVRFALYCCDIPLLITPAPGLISIVLSPQRQRIGDRVADSIVIRNRQSGPSPG